MLREVWQRDDAQNLPEYALILTLVLAASGAAVSQIVVKFLPAIQNAAGSMHR
jgi:hypothetical protein